MSEEPKSATGLIVQQVAAIVPQSDKNSAGRDIGKALKNVGSIARDLSDLLAGVVSIPRRASEFMVRALSKFRQIPDERRRTPSPKLLLEAAQGYAHTDDNDLRTCFERLVDSAMDTKTAALVHPSFVVSLNQMSGTDARFMRLLGAGAKFIGFAAFYEALGIASLASMVVTMDVLTRLGYMTKIGPASLGPAEHRDVTPLPGQIFVYEQEHSGRPIDNPPRSMTYFKATPVGRAFTIAVGAYVQEGHDDIWIA